ncbi:MAG: ATP-dependent Clp protease proteolytic subunit [Janthinobacterium lividum]
MVALLVRVGVRTRVSLLAITAVTAGCQPAAAPVAAIDVTAVNGVGYVVINAPIAPQSRDLFIADVDKLRARGAKEIDIGLNSPGGAIQSAQDIVEYMARLHRDNGIVFKVYNVGLVASAATYVFLAAQDRYSAPKGVFLFHAAGMVANGMVTSERLRESADILDAYERKIRAALVSRTHLTDGEAQIYVRRTVLLNADDAKRDGVIDAIADMRFPKGAQAYVITTVPPAGAPRAAAPTTEQGR